MWKKSTEKELNKYYREIKKNLPVSRKEKKKFVSELKGSIEEYMGRNREVSSQEIMEQFGTPEAIALSFIEQEDNGKTVETVMRSRRKYGFILLSICFVLVLVTATCIFVVFDTYNINHGYFSEDVIEEEIIEDTEN